MSTNTQTAPSPRLSRDEREKWWESFRAGVEHVRAKDGQTPLALPAITRAASEAAWAEIDAFRQAVKGKRP
jgi:hypothetical protein